LIGLEAAFHEHPYATMVTGVFLFTLLVTVAYFFGVVPGESKTEAGLNRLIIISVILLMTTIVAWVAAISMTSSDG
jgi:membrane protein DedA with SNARE-associated domain